MPDILTATTLIASAVFTFSVPPGAADDLIGRYRTLSQADAACAQAIASTEGASSRIEYGEGRWAAYLVF
ncbi:hypothetical protein [Amycolatopsis thailandensis]|uniref:hypothetical protein n=1 Tax=Amycolatopsis thailandensis TaxID=589330 RepID=UPI00362C20B2